MEEIEEKIKNAKDLMNKAIEHTQKEFNKIRAGKANPSMIDGVMVNYYGNMTPINQVASITSPDARTINIKPWEKSLIPEIEKAIINGNLGLNPQNDGEFVVIRIPMLTEERRLQLTKQVKAEAEKGKISIRNYRKETNDKLKKIEGISQDITKDAESKVQKITNEYTELIDKMVTKKEQDIMNV